MTSKNNTLRCAASTIYSMAGPNTPSGAVNAPIEGGSARLDGIVCSLLAAQPVCEGCYGCRPALARARRRQRSRQVRRPSFQGGALPYLGRDLTVSTPPQRHAEISGQPSGI